MPRLECRGILDLRSLFVDGLRSAEDAAKNVAPARVAAIVAVALVSIRVLAIALIIAAHKALTKSLRGGILVVTRTLRVVALTTLSITGARVQARLVTLVQLNLIPVVVPTVIAVATVVAIAAFIAVATVVAVGTVV